MLHIGLTGGIGSGKSTVARMFARKGAVILDSDGIVRELLSPGGEGAEAVAAAFGDRFLRADGSADRKALAALVFDDAEAKGRLERILHPLVVSRRRAILSEIRGERGEGCVVLSEAALIFEAGTRKEFDGVILVTAPVEVRRRRLLSAGWDAGEVGRRMASQWPDEAKAPLADWVLENGGDPEEAERRVDSIWGILEGRARAAR